MHSTTERLRIILSRLAAVIVAFFLFTSQSHWQTHDDWIAILLFCTGIVLATIAALGRMWCSLFIAGYKDDQLVTDGPYSLCRNPLYFFSMIGVLGIGCATRTLTFPVLFIILFALYYPFVIRGEESRLRQLFGSAFDAYASRVPAFFPRLATFSEPEDYPVKPRVFREHILSAVWFVWFIAILELIAGVRAMGWFKPLWTLY